MRWPLALVLLILVACASNAPAARPIPLPKEESTLTWDRHATADLFVVYACWTKDCTNLKAVGTVAPPRTGKPEFKVYLSGKVGAFAVTAKFMGSESGLSNVVRFDRR